jgi:two-component system nitrate/nitrite response regulator NarL
VTEGSQRVLIADDSVVTRYGIRVALEREGFEICAEAADARAAVELALSERPDICILDILMPEGGGIRAVREIASQLPEAKLVMLTGSEAGEDVRDALRMGATGYVLKDENLRGLTKAIREVARGGRPMSKRAVGELLEDERLRFRRAKVAAGRGALLSEREWDVLELLASGRSEQEVALRLGVDADTISTDATLAEGKLGVESREAALELARELRAESL